MPKTRVNPTRMELTRLKGKLATAVRGHKLLKDKRDELMRQFLELVRENKALREEVEAGINEANKNFVLARLAMSTEAVNVAFMSSKQEVTLDVSSKNIMSVEVPVFKSQTRTSDENDIYSYGLAFTSSDLEDAVGSLSDLLPKMLELAEKEKMPIAGKDFKTGQTLVKSGFAPILGVRNLGLNGWFSTNILGNRDGLVLDEPANFHTKEVSKLSTLETILKAEDRPDLYTDYYHKVRINYYPPRNDNKESWDNIDIFGWMGYPMQIKINFLCRDSILAAPVCLDLCLLSDLAARAGRYGIQRFLSFFLKSPMHDYTKDETPVNNLYQQYTMLKNEIRLMGGYEADEEID